MERRHGVNDIAQGREFNPLIKIAVFLKKNPSLSIQSASLLIKNPSHSKKSPYFSIKPLPSQ
jgi:hypothetical protein